MTNGHPNLTVHVIGLPRVTREGAPLPLTRKAAALLTYLALERRAVHRSTVASLLWPGERSLGSLRVELTKLRQLGIDLAPQRAPLLRFSAPTDLERLGRLAHPSLTPAQARGGLLEGIEEEATPALLAWAQEKRRQLEIRRQVFQQSAADTAEPLIAGAVAWLAGQLAPSWQAVTRQAASEPPVLLVTARDGDGTREALSALIAGQPASASLQLDAVADPQLFLSSLLLRLSPLMPAAAQSALRRTLTGSPAHEVLQRALVSQLLQLPQGLSLVVHQVGPDLRGLEPLLQLIQNWPLPLVTVLVTRPESGAILRRQLRGRLGHRLHCVRTPDICSAALGDDPERWTPHLRQSEGHLGTLAALLEHPGALPLRVRLTHERRHALHGSLDQLFPGHLEALSRLAGLRAPFTREQALRTLTGANLTDAAAEDVLRGALQAGLIEHLSPTIRVSWPALTTRDPDGDHPLAFQSELTRSALAATLDAATRAALRRPPPQTRAPSLLPIFPVPPASLPASSRAADVEAAPAAVRGTFQRSVHFPGGYRAEQWTTGLSIMRLGAAGHGAPTLQLYFPPQAGPLVYRVDEVEAVDGQACLRLAGADSRSFSLPVQSGGWWMCPVPQGQPWTLEVEARHLTLHLGVAQQGLWDTLPAPCVAAEAPRSPQATGRRDVV